MQRCTPLNFAMEHKPIKAQALQRSRRVAALIVCLASCGRRRDGQRSHLKLLYLNHWNK